MDALLYLRYTNDNNKVYLLGAAYGIEPRKQAYETRGEPTSLVMLQWVQKLDLNQWFPAYEADEDGQTPLSCNKNGGRGEIRTLKDISF